jgi:hypothetical protein
MIRRRNSLAIERLENRLALAGNITVTQVGADLIILGDELSNSLTLTTTSTGMWALSGRISAQPVDTTINEQDTTDTPVLVSPPTGSLVVRLGDGNDRFDIFVFDSPLRIQTSFVVETGKGDDTAQFIGVSAASVGTATTIELGDGSDHLSLGGFGIGTDTIIRGGSGNDSINVSRGSCRDLVIHADEGYDAVRVEFAQIRNSTLVNGGADGDRVELVRTDFANDSAVFGNHGGDAIFVLGARPHKSLFINAGPDFAYIQIRQSILGTSTYVINEGPTQTDIDGSQFKRLEIFVGPEGDSVTITRCTVEEFFASLGESSDAFKLIANRVNQRGRIDGQGGFDVFTQGDNVLTNVEVVGFEFFPPPQSFTLP